MKPFAKKFYKSSKWIKCRNAYFISQHGICERCEGKYGVGKIVHHTVYLTADNIDDPNITLNHELLELHCQDCHNKEHRKNNVDVVEEGLMFDEYGQLVKVEYE